MSAGGPCSSWLRSGANSWAAPMKCRGSTGEGWLHGQEWSCSSGGWGAGSTGEGQPGLAGEGAGDDQVRLDGILSVLVLWHLMDAQSGLLSGWTCAPCHLERSWWAANTCQ